MTQVVETSGAGLNLFKATIKLAGGTDTCHIVARDMEDAVEHVRKAYEDLNVLYIESVTRVGGLLFVSEGAKEVLSGSGPATT